MEENRYFVKTPNRDPYPVTVLYEYTGPFSGSTYVVASDERGAKLTINESALITEREAVRLMVTRASETLSWIRKNTDYDWTLEIVGTTQKMDGPRDSYGIVVADQTDFTHRTNAFVIHEDDDD